MDVADSKVRAERTVVLGLVGAIAALLVFAWLAFSVASGTVIRFDNAVRGFVHRFASPDLTAAMRLLSAIGEPGTLLSLGLTILLAALAVNWNRSAVRFVLTMVGAFALDMTLKLAFHRTRPAAFFGTPLPHSYSFPSGHALFSVCFFGAAAALVSPRLRSSALRITVWSIAVAMAVLIGLSRIYLGVHYPSDVVAGYAAAIVWVSALAHADRLLLARYRARRTQVDA